MGKDIRVKGQNDLLRAKQLYNAKQYKKAGKSFISAANTFLRLQEYEIVRESFIRAAKSFLYLKKFTIILELLRNAGSAALFNYEFLEAQEIFKKAINYVPHLRKPEDRNYNYVLFSTLSYLCLFIKGKQEKGLELIKKIKEKVGSVYFKESILIKLVTNLTVAIRDNNDKKLKKVEIDFEYYEFLEAEEKLAKLALFLAKSNISIITDLKIEKETYSTNEVIKLTLEIDTKPLTKISKNNFYGHVIKEINILKIVITLSDNLTVQKKPIFPLKFQPGKKYYLDYEIKPYFQVDNTFIGPFLLTCEMDGEFLFFLKTPVIKPKLISPPPTLEISTKNLRPPLVNKTFPFEIFIENNSEGEALDLNFDIYFPEQIKIIRGTTKKQIYSLRKNENMTWEIQLKPIEPGEFTIQINMKFKDPDENIIEDSKNFPLLIKL
ncbi:MAG: hypothetical protein ACTSRI_01870 [Promethearchaeota archaeon]